MHRLAIHCVYRNDDTPETIGIKIDGGQLKIHELYVKDRFLIDIFEKEQAIYKLIDKFAANGEVVISNCKRFIDHFGGIPPNVYDFPVRGELAAAEMQVILDTMLVEPAIWQRASANAALVYAHMQQVGIINGVLTNPQWSMDTHSGRSKSTVFNLQGADGKNDIMNCRMDCNGYFVHMDWVAADLRIASLLSGDEYLSELCLTGDPYEAMTKEFEGLDRETCKIGILKAINSLSYTQEILKPFPKLRGWMEESKHKLQDGGAVETLLGRKFHMVESKLLSAFNGCMQGSIAHAMHISLDRMAELYLDNIMADLHDALVVSCNERQLTSLIRDMRTIMVRPFRGILDTDPMFPIRISVGRRWKQWKVMRLWRE